MIEIKTLYEDLKKVITGIKTEEYEDSMSLEDSLSSDEKQIIITRRYGKDTTEIYINNFRGFKTTNIIFIKNNDTENGFNCDLSSEDAIIEIIKSGSL